MILTRLLLLFIISSCALFQSPKLSQDLQKDIQKVCLSSEGKGRIIVNSQKYVFSYESALRDEEQNWVMALNFPIYGEEYVEIDWKQEKMKHTVSFENKLLKDQRGLSPEKLELFLKSWGEFLHEIILLKQNKLEKSHYNWELGSKQLMASKNVGDSKVKISFKNLVEEKHFGRYDIATHYQDSKNLFKIEVIVRKCLEKLE